MRKILLLGALCSTFLVRPRVAMAAPDTVAGETSGPQRAAGFLPTTDSSQSEDGAAFVPVPEELNRLLNDGNHSSGNRTDVDSPEQGMQGLQTGPAATRTSGGDELAPSKWSRAIEGWLANQSAYRARSPSGPSMVRERLLLAEKASWGDLVRFRSTQRGSYDSVFDLSDHYPPSVSGDEREELNLRDTYLDVSAGSLDIRLGKQQIVWGEAVGVFVADIVNAKDYREFVLPDFEMLRIPEWAADVTLTRDEVRVEAVWIPFPEMNRYGRPGSDFAPRVPGSELLQGGAVPEEKPARTPENAELGGRLTWLVSGWYLSTFYLYGWERSPVYERSQADDAPGMMARHFRARFAGGSFSKALGPTVVKGELVYSPGVHINTTDPTDEDGVIRRDALDYDVGVDPEVDHIQLSIQVIRHQILGSDSSIADGEQRTGTFLSLWARPRGEGWRVRPEVFVIAGAERADLMLRPRLVFDVGSSVRATIGLDIFAGDSEGTFGQFERATRAYSELRFSF